MTGLTGPITMRRHLIPAVLATTLAVPCGPARAQAIARTPETHGGVLIDITAPRAATPAADRRAIPFVAMPNQAGQVTLTMAAQASSPTAPAVVHVDRDAAEAPRLHASPKVATRTGKRLQLRSSGETTFSFVDAQRPAQADAEGDSVAFRYAGPIAGTPFHQVDQIEAHDAPSAWLVSAAAPVALMVRPFDGPVVVSPQGGRVAQVTQALDDRLDIRVGALDGATWRNELVCQATVDARSSQLVAQFKGWHAAPAVGFDLVLLHSGNATDATPRYAAVALRLSLVGGQWRAQSSNPEQLAREVGLSCWSPRR